MIELNDKCVILWLLYFIDFDSLSMEMLHITSVGIILDELSSSILSISGISKFEFAK